MSIIKKILTLGASARIEKKLEEYEEYIQEYTTLNKVMEANKIKLNKIFELLIIEKVESINTLKKIEEISKNLKGKEREFSNEEINFSEENINFEKIEDTISLGEAAINGGKGIATGVSTALGSWALVSSFGVASTGTAISTLSGVAATNATLAWFGGGSLATGGAGIAGGTAILGGIIAIPILFTVGIFSHLSANKKILEIEKKISEVINAISNIKNNLLVIDSLEKRTEEVIDSLSRTRKIFDKEFNKTLKKIYPIPLISLLKKLIRKHIFRKKYFSKKDMEEIAYIGKIAVNFAEIIDTKVL